MKKLRHFDWDEFDSPDAPGSGIENMQPSTMGMLDEARHQAGVPFVLTSAYRTELYNLKVGGVADSSHPDGWAVDITAVGVDMKRRILRALYRVGFRRFGIMRNAIHADNDPTKPAGVWEYKEKRDGRGRVVRWGTAPSDWALFGTLDKISKL